MSLGRSRRQPRFAAQSTNWDSAVLIPTSILALSLLAAICLFGFWIWPDPVAPPEHDMFYKFPPPIAFEIPSSPTHMVEPIKAEPPKGGIVIEK